MADTMEEIKGRYFGGAEYAPGEYAVVLHIHASSDLAYLIERVERAERERDGWAKHANACAQIAGKALGYPWYKDDQKNFPGATEAEGVCIGDHVPDTIVEELVNAYEKCKRERDAARSALSVALEYMRECGANLDRDYPELVAAAGGSSDDR
jgi:hypothetical protein